MDWKVLTALTNNTDPKFNISLAFREMAENAEKGVIDKNNKVFGYENMLIVDGSMISANPGVNPSLSITAIAEHAMNRIDKK